MQPRGSVTGGGEAEAGVALRPVLTRRSAGRRPERRGRRRRGWSRVVGNVVLDVVVSDVWRTHAQCVGYTTSGERHKHYTCTHQFSRHSSNVRTVVDRFATH